MSIKDPYFTTILQSKFAGNKYTSALHFGNLGCGRSIQGDGVSKGHEGDGELVAGEETVTDDAQDCAEVVESQGPEN